MAGTMLVFFVAAASGHSGCGHDSDPGTTSGGVRDTGYFFNKNVQYADSPTRGRALQTSAYQPIRIHIDYPPGATSALTADQDNFFRNTLMPAAVAWLQASLMVVPVLGSLLYARWCASSFTSGTCARVGSSYCGLTSNGNGYSNHVVPDTYLDELRTCSTCYTNGQCSSCTHRSPTST